MTPSDQASSTDTELEESERPGNRKRRQATDVLFYSDSCSLFKKMSILDGFIVNTNSPRLMGLFLMAGAGFFLTIGNVIVQYIHKVSKIKVSSFEILFVRSLIQLVLSVAFMFYGRVHPFGKEKKNLITLCCMGIAETAAIVFVYFALEKMPVADATVIQFTAPVFTLAISFLCLRRGCSFTDGICGVLSFVGVVVMTRPSFLFDRSHSIVYHSQHVGNAIIGSQPGDPTYMLGVWFALLAAIMLSTFFILNKMTGQKLDIILTVFYPSLFGVITGPICEAAFHQPLYKEAEWRIWACLVTVGIVSFIGMMFMAESLQLEDAGPAILIRNLDAIYAFALQYIFLHITPHWLSITGAGIILLATSLIAINRSVCSKYDLRNCQKKKVEEEEVDATKFLLYDGDTDD